MDISIKNTGFIVQGRVEEIEDKNGDSFYLGEVYLGGLIRTETGEYRIRGQDWKDKTTYESKQKALEYLLVAVNQLKLNNRTKKEILEDE